MKPQETLILLSPEQMFSDYHAGIREYLLNRTALALMDEDFEKSIPYIKAAETIAQKQAERNSYAITIEKNLLEGALFLYEENIAEMFIGEHPYQRLRVLYTRQKDYTNAIRVCRRYIEMANLAAAIGIDNPSSKKQDEYQQWIEKLTSKQEEYNRRHHGH